MKIDFRIFYNRLGRRIFLIFVCNALIPILILSTIACQEVIRQLNHQSLNRLNQAAKSQGMAIYERLMTLQSELEFIALMPAEKRHVMLAESCSEKYLYHHFDVLAAGIPGRCGKTLRGVEVDISPVSEADAAFLQSGKTVLRVHHEKKNNPVVQLIRPVASAASDRSVLVGTVNTSYLFGLGHEKSIPPMTNSCLLDASGQMLVNTTMIDDNILAGRIRDAGSRNDRWVSFVADNDEYLASVWPLFLKSNFLIPKWTVVLIQSREAILEPVQMFRWNFLLIITLSFWVVILLSSLFIRKTLAPLNTIKSATRQIADGDLGATVAVVSRDEFADLADTFNQMSRQLKVQFETLKTVSEIDRAVLSSRETQIVAQAGLERLPGFLNCDDACFVVCGREKTGSGRAFSKHTDGKMSSCRIEISPQQKEWLKTCRESEPQKIDATICRDLFGPLLKDDLQWCRIVPLTAEKELLGLFVFAYRRQPLFTVEELNALQQVARQVSIALNNAFLSEELVAARDELDQANQSLEKKVTERTREFLEANQQLRGEIARRKVMERELFEAKGAAEKASRAKSDFLASMSHELRTPLNHIIGFTELVIDKHFGDLNPVQEEYLGDVHKSSRHLLALINDILDLSKVEAGKLELAPSNVCPAQLVENSLSMIKEKVMKHAIRLETRLEALPETIFADERKLKQVIYNLLSNAVKFTPDGGSIIIEGRMNPAGGIMVENMVEICVTDTGMGIKSDELEKIFKPFEQASTTGRLHHQGTGLGLPLTQRLVELHGGTISVKSDGPGTGCRFCFSLPVDCRRIKDLLPS